jgi:hypothetical protein
MALLQIDSDMARSLDKILAAAAKVLNEVHAVYNDDGEVTAAQIETVSHLRVDLGQMLGRFSDGAAFVGDDYHAAAIGAMRAYEEMADAWLRAVYNASGMAPTEEVERVAPGRYRVVRKRETAQGVVYRQAVCTNPAVARRRFDEAENQSEAA